MPCTANSCNARRTRLSPAVWLIGSALVLGGCATMDADRPARMLEVLGAVETGQAAPAIPAPLVPFVRQDYQDGARNSVLHDMRAGVVGFEMGTIRHSRALLADAYQSIETVYADNPNAKAARSNFVPEAKKDFKGEPYERAMVGYYLGLVDMVSGDLENAQASFRWGEFQDTMSASETYRDDMALHNFLTGWVRQCQGNAESAREHYERARIHRSALTVPGRGDNFLLVAELGSGPKKIHTGQHREGLQYEHSQKNNAAGVAFSVGATTLSGLLAEDVYFQATTLGGRTVDKILAGKAVFKETAKDVADTATAVAAVSLDVAAQASLYGDRDLAKYAGGLGVLGALTGLVAKGVEKNVKAEADTRYWDNLPERVYVATTQVSQMPDKVEARFLGSDNSPLSTGEMKLYRTGSCYLAWGREFPSVAGWSEQAEGGWVSVTDLQTSLQAVPKAKAGPASGSAKESAVVTF